MTTLDELHEKGQAMRTAMAGGNPKHFAVPGVDRLAPDLRRIIDEALFGSIWPRDGLTLQARCICTLSALMALGQLPLLRRHLDRCLNVGMPPEQVVEVFMQLTFYVGVPAVETALRITEEVFEEKGVQFTPTRVHDSQRTIEELYQMGLRTQQEHMGDAAYASEPDSKEGELDHLINAFHWGAIYSRPYLDAKSRAMCSLSAMTVLGRYDRQIRRRIEGALRVGLSPAEIMEVFIQVTLYGGAITARTAMRIAQSVFTEQGVAEQEKAPG